MLEESRGKRGTGKIMRYRIGEVSELIGVSNEALRNYERAGIIQSWRTEGSNIRYYDIETISKLIGIRSRRNEGFGIKEIQRIYTDISGEEYHALVKEKIAGMERELALRQLYLQRMRWMEEQLSVSERTPNRCVFARSPRFHTLRYREGDCLNSPSVMKVWAKHLFFIQHFVQYRAGDFLGRGISCEVSLAAQAEELALLESEGEADSPAVTIREPMDCVLCTCERRDIHDPYAACASAIGDFMHKEGLRLAGDPFSISICGYHQGGGRRTVINLYLPV